MNKFVILSELRTGYKWLANMLSSHPEAFCFGEIFGSEESIRQISLLNKNIKAIKATDNPIFWLKNNIEEYGNKNKLKAIGFKLNYVDGRLNRNWDSLWKYVSDEYKIIHLTRENLIDRTLSELLAMHENNWSDQPYKSKIDIDPKHILKMIFRSELWQEEARKMFKDRFEITYEQIQFEPQILENLQRWLGLNLYSLKSFHIKQRNKKQSEYIGNYQEISKMIKTYFPHYKNMLDPVDIKI